MARILPSPSHRVAHLRFILVNEIRGILRSQNGGKQNQSEVVRKRSVIRSQKKLAQEEMSNLSSAAFDAEHRAYYRTLFSEYQHALRTARPHMRVISASKDIVSFKKARGQMAEALMHEFGQKKGRQFNRLIHQEYPELAYRPAPKSSIYFKSAEDAIEYTLKSEELAKHVLRQMKIHSRQIQDIWEAILPSVVNRLLGFDPARGSSLKTYYQKAIRQATNDYVRHSLEYPLSVARAIKKAEKEGRPSPFPKRESNPALNVNALSSNQLDKIFDIIDVRSEHRAENRLLREHLLRAIRLLPMNDQRVLFMHFAHGMSFREIARDIGKQEPAVSKNIQKSLVELRRLLAKEK